MKFTVQLLLYLRRVHIQRCDEGLYVLERNVHSCQHTFYQTRHLVTCSNLRAKRWVFVIRIYIIAKCHNRDIISHYKDIMCGI